MPIFIQRPKLIKDITNEVEFIPPAHYAKFIEIDKKYENKKYALNKDIKMIESKNTETNKKVENAQKNN